MISLHPLDKDNWVDFAYMQLPPEQQHFLAPNVFTIAESRFNPEQTVMGIHKDNSPIGLVAFCEDAEFQEADWWLYRLMITPDQQCKGHGKQAILAAIRLMLDAGAKRIVTMCKPANSVAFDLYTKLGFAEAGTLEDGDTLLVLPRDTAQSLCRRI